MNTENTENTTTFTREKTRIAEWEAKLKALLESSFPSYHREAPSGWSTTNGEYARHYAASREFTVAAMKATQLILFHHMANNINDPVHEHYDEEYGDWDDGVRFEHAAKAAVNAGSAIGEWEMGPTLEALENEFWEAISQADDPKNSHVEHVKKLADPKRFYEVAEDSPGCETGKNG